MKKGLTTFIKVAALLICTMTIIGTAAAAPHVEIATSTEVIGEGVYSSEIEIQGSRCASGLKYYGEAYTPSLGVHGPSTIVLATEYFLTRNNYTELQAAEESEMGNIRAKRCFKNYELGTLQAFNTFGDYNVMAEFGGDVNMSMMAIEASVSGNALSEVTVRDLNASHFYIVRDKATYKGDYKIALSSLIERAEEPKAGDDEWLGCP
jgi:hypothetical protein